MAMTDSVKSVEERDDYGPYRVECPECDYGNEPGLEMTAKWYRQKHKRSEGHECEITEVESDE